MKKVLLSLLLFTLIFASISYAAVPVARTDNILERLFLSRYTEMQSWLENIVYSVNSPETLGELLRLPDRIKSISESFDASDLMGDMLDDVLDVAMDIGNDLLGDLGNYIDLDDLLSGNFDSLVSQIINEVKDIPIGGDSSSSDSAKAAAAKAMVETVETVPMSIPSVTAQTAQQIVRESSTIVARKQNTIAVTEQAKLNLMEEYAAFIAKYSGENSPHAKKREEMLKSIQEVVDHTRQYASNIPKGQIEDAILKVSGDQVVMLALQNTILLNMIDTAADEITLLSKIGLAGAEGYAENLKKNIQDRVDIYDYVKGNK